MKWEVIYQRVRRLSMYASRPDKISGYILKGTAKAITTTLTHLFNLSLRNCKIPEKWKTSCVVPIPKAQKYTENLNNY